MQILERRGTSLAEIIANRLCEDKPEAMLAIISKYTPLDVQVEVTASDSIADALANVQAVMASNRAKVIDVEPDDSE
jgi:predicted nuclease with RNAse H fold